MSVSLREVIEAGGYDLGTESDAQWLLSKEAEFDNLINEAEDLIEELNYEEEEK